MRVLLVEDHLELAQTIATVLRREGMAVDVAHDGNDALERATVNAYQVVVLDRDLPGLHGDELCRELVRTENSARVVMLTAADSVAERVEGLALGADDYLAKPFAFAELIARIRSVDRRRGTPSSSMLTAADISLDVGRRVAFRGGDRLVLTAKELAVLEHLLRARGATVSTEELLEAVWDEHTNPFTTTVKATMARLRRKLGEPSIIETVPNLGYRIEP